MIELLVGVVFGALITALVVGVLVLIVANTR